jgi:hypothetical protein
MRTQHQMGLAAAVAMAIAASQGAESTKKLPVEVSMGERNFRSYRTSGRQEVANKTRRGVRRQQTRGRH